MPRAIGPVAVADAAKSANEFIAAQRWSDALEPVRSLAQANPDNHIYAQQLARVYHT